MAAYGGGYYSEAYDRGLREGEQKGREDAKDGDRYDPRRHNWYRDGDRGYKDRYGSREQYKAAYRDAFERGYAQGYRVRLRLRQQRRVALAVVNDDRPRQPAETRRGARGAPLQVKEAFDPGHQARGRLGRRDVGDRRPSAGNAGAPLGDHAADAFHQRRLVQHEGPKRV